MNSDSPLTVRMLLLGFLLFSAPAFAQEPVADEELARVEDRLEALTEEVARLREQIAIPETDQELTSAYGMGPAASKVYGVSQGISLGGYGEFYFAAPVEQRDETGARRVSDFYRFITYFGYKFNDRIVMNTEIEYEHGAGSISLEFAYLDFLLHEQINVRAGNLLVPMGFINEMHEPAFYRGNFRPEVERRIIPTTWHEMGLGVHGDLAAGLRYGAYGFNGLDATGFNEAGVRGGRQKANRALWEDVGGVVNLAYDHGGQLQIASSGFYGGADQNAAELEGNKVSNWIWEAHARLAVQGLEARALFALAGIDGARELSEIIYATGSTDQSKLVPKQQMGWYGEVAYDIAPALFGSRTSWQFSPWVRYERFDLQHEVPEIPGRAANAALDVTLWTVGLDVKPHPSVVLKLDYVISDNGANEPSSDELRLGAGFVY